MSAAAAIAAISVSSFTARSCSTRPAGRHELHAVRDPLGEPAYAATVTWSSSNPTVPRSRFATSSRRSRLAPPQLEVPHLLLRLLHVAEVGEEDPLVAPDDAGAVRAREAGQVADVGQVRHDQRVEPALREHLHEPVRAGGAHWSWALRSSSASSVAVRALPLDRRDAQVADHGHAPPLLPLVHGGQVHLHRRQVRHLERVADRPRVVGPRARVEDQPVGALAGPVQPLAELALVIRLRRSSAQPELARELLDLHLELGERHAAVVLGPARRRARRSSRRASPRCGPSPGVCTSSTAARSAAASTS